jgi:predicted DNA-binding transcriptional regulator YafY
MPGKPTKEEVARRRARVLKLTSEGVDTATLARMYGVTSRTILRDLEAERKRLALQGS